MGVEGLAPQEADPTATKKACGVGKTRGTSDDNIPVLVVRDSHKSTATVILDKVDALHIHVDKGDRKRLILRQ